LLLCILKCCAIEVGLESDSLVLEDVNLIFIPVAEYPLSIDQMLEQATEDSLHHKVATWALVGQESW